MISSSSWTSPRAVVEEEGLQAVFRSVFPITDFSNTASLEFVKYEFEQPKYDVDECRQRDMTFAAPLKVTLRLIVFEVDEETGARSVKDIKEQDVYMGDMPFMTMNGTFIVNGTERVIVSQMHRSPGVFFDHDKGKTHSSGKLLFAGRIIPYRGSWLDIEFDAKDIVFARIDRRRKIPVTSLLKALGMDAEEILRTYYNTLNYERTKKRLAQALRRREDEERQADARPDRRQDRQGRPRGRQEALGPPGQEARRERPDAPRWRSMRISTARSSPRTSSTSRPARSTSRPATRSTRSCSPSCTDAGFDELPILDIDHVTVGAYIRNTLAVDKNESREDALFDIYRVMRPGEPPTVETAEAMFKSLFFDSERYDLSAVGRVKMNMRLELEAEDTVRTLRKEDIVEVVRTLVEPPRRPRRDRRHRQPRQPPGAFGRRAHGEPLPARSAPHGARHQGAHVVGRDRHRHAAGPDQRQAGGCRRARVLRLVASSASSWTRPTRSPRSRTSVVSRRSGRAV